MVELTYFGHDVFLITHNGTRLIIDPFISGNPMATTEPEKGKGGKNEIDV